MSKSSLSAHVDQVADVLRDLMRQRSRLRMELSPDLAQAQAQLDKLRSASKARGMGDHTLFIQVGVVLSRHREPLSMGELSKALNVPLSTATRIVDWWVKSGYAERSPGEQDRRVVRVALTETGQELVKTSNKLIRQRIEQVLRRFTPEERETLVVLMRKLVESLENEGD